MAFYVGYLELPTQKKQQMVDITARVRAEVKSSGVQNGLCTVFAPHTTGAITINAHEVASGQCSNCKSFQSTEKYRRRR